MIIIKTFVYYLFYYLDSFDFSSNILHIFQGSVTSLVWVQDFILRYKTTSFKRRIQKFTLADVKFYSQQKEEM